MDNLHIYEKYKNVPEEAKKKIQAGRTKGFTDINPMWRIKCLTKEFGPCGIGWYYKVTKQWTEQYGEEIAVFVNIELYVKHGGQWSEPIFGSGGSMFAAKESKGIYVSDECYKMATTDALSVACKQLGIGADVYWEKDSTKYSTMENTTTITKQMIDEISKEIQRTGIDVRRIVGTYGKKKLEELSENDYLDAMSKLKKMESIPPKTPNVPTEPEEYCGLPFK